MQAPGLMHFNFALIALLLSSLTFMGSASAATEWVYIHGHSGHVENSSIAESVSAEAHPGEFSCYPSPLGTWVHYAVPTISMFNAKQASVRYLRLKFATASSDAALTSISLWDGNIEFHTIDGSWSGENDILVDLGRKWNIYRALGVSLKFQGGIEPMDHHTVIRAVGARWQW